MPVCFHFIPQKIKRWAWGWRDMVKATEVGTRRWVGVRPVCKTDKDQSNHDNRLLPKAWAWGGGGVSWLGISPKFWKMPCLPQGSWLLQKSLKSPTVTGRERNQRGRKGKISKTVLAT